MEFEAFEKIARLRRGMVVTEKIDGTNAQVHILAPPDQANVYDYAAGATAANSDLWLLMFAGSRTQYITPERDNFGFAAWVNAHADALWALGPGRHYGEWWGSGIQRGYGLEKGEKRFSLFNVRRWHAAGQPPLLTQGADPRVPPKASIEAPACCGVVPVLHIGPFDLGEVSQQVEKLRLAGSAAAPGFMRPEGVVVFHQAGGTLFKQTLEGDEMPKSLAEA